MNATVLISLLLSLLDRASVIGALISKARSENRDVTSAELDALVATDQLARQALVDAIANAKAGIPPPPPAAARRP